MRGVRNPFRLSTAESIETDADFLRLFGPGVLELLPEGVTKGGLLFIRSAPGGGKTTLLRAFTPSVLLSLLALRVSDPYREIYSKLRELDVVDENGLRVLGIMLTCRRTFPSLEDLNFHQTRADRLLRALLDARILLGAFRAILVSNHCHYPDDLHRLSIGRLRSGTFPPGLQLPSDGLAAQKWAEQLETSVCDAIDSLRSADTVDVRGHDVLHSLEMLDECVVQLDGEAPKARWLVLLDDVHKLSATQRASLHQTLLEGRNATGTWVAERLEALSTGEMLATGVLEGRDYWKVVNLEDAWRRNQGRRSFAAAVSVIAERRARMAADVIAGSLDVGSFAANLDPGQDLMEYADRTSIAIQVVLDRVRKIADAEPRYGEWIRSRSGQEGTPREKLIGLRALEILIERDLRKKQMALDLELPASSLEQREDSAVRNAAELFLAKEFDFPYYFGSECVANLGFQNVEQFLRLAGDLFEESLSAALIRRSPVLSPERQQRILEHACEARLSELPRRAGRDLVEFIDSIGKYCREETYRPSAPYAPGVTGIAISMTERVDLMDSRHPEYRRLADILATALSQNVIRAVADYKVKGGLYMVFYLNRLICLRYRLPLQYGGFREKSLKELMNGFMRGSATGARMI